MVRIWWMYIDHLVGIWCYEVGIWWLYGSYVAAIWWVAELVRYKFFVLCALR